MIRSEVVFLKKVVGLVAVTLLIALFLSIRDVGCGITSNLGNVMLNQGIESRFSSFFMTHAAQLLSHSVRVCEERESQLRLGYAHLTLGNLPEAERAFTEVVAAGIDDSRAYVWLSDALVRQNKKNEAIHQLLELLEEDPLAKGASENLEQLYRQQGMEDPLATVESSEGQTSSAYRGELTLSLASTRPRWLTIFFEQGTLEEVSVELDGEASEMVHQKQVAAGWKGYFLVPDRAEDAVHVQIRSESAPVTSAISAIWLEYVSHGEWFSDVTDAPWTDFSYSVVRPGQEYHTYLYSTAADPRFITVNFFDQNDRYLSLYVNNEKLGEIVGGKRDFRRRGGPTEFTFQVPQGTDNLLRVTLFSSEETRGGAAVRYVYVQGGNQ